MTASNPHIPPEKLAERLNVSLRTVERWRATGEGPRFIRCGRRRVVYPVAEVESWEAERTHVSRVAEMQGSVA